MMQFAIFFLLFMVSIGLTISTDEILNVQNECLPRDRATARQQGYRCQNACKYDSDCVSHARRCVCDGLCGASCVRINLRCKQPEAPKNGSISKSSLKFNSTVQYSCQPGYQLDGAASRTCRGNGQWDHEQPVCLSEIFVNMTRNHSNTDDDDSGIDKAENTTTSLKNYIGIGFVVFEDDFANGTIAETYTTECLNPPFAENSIVLERDSRFAIGSKVTYKCNYGFYARAKNTHDSRIRLETECLLNATSKTTFWTPLSFQCQHKSCSYPGDIANGKRHGSLFAVGEEIRFECNEGYTLVGRGVIFCTPLGTWSRSLPVCQVSKCAEPEIPENGKVQYDSLEYKSIAAYSCLPPFTLIGQSQRACLANKSWSGHLPSCQIAKCVPPNFISNGQVIVGNGPIITGYKIQFECDGGSILSGDKSATCMQDGSWSRSLPKCTAACQVENVANGQIVTHFQQSNRAELVCNDGFQVVSSYENKQELYCSNGMWQPSIECIPASCHRSAALPLIPANGRLLSSNSYGYTAHNKRMTVRCSSGYVPRNYYHIQCQFGQWSWLEEPLDACRPQPCTVRNENIGSNVYLNFRLEQEFQHGFYRLECQENYRLQGDAQVRCNFGQWFPKSFPDCQPNPCRLAVVENGETLKASAHGTERTIYCQNGYSANVSSVVCKYGDWKPNVPSCVRDKQNETMNQLFQGNGGNVLADVCIYDPSLYRNVLTDVRAMEEVTTNIAVRSGTRVTSRCKNRTYFKSLSGEFISTCVNGEWQPSPPLSCRPVQYGDVVTPFKVYGSSNSFHHSLEVIMVKKHTYLDLRCYVHGYSSSMIWQTNAKFLSVIEFDGPELVYKIRDAKWTHQGKYRCRTDSGYYDDINISIVEEFLCPSTVPWQGTALKTSFQGRQIGDEVAFFCESGYTLEGESSAQCNKHYLWQTDNPPFCARTLACPRPTTVLDSSLQLDPDKESYGLGERIRLSCSNGNIIQNSKDFMQCKPNGWDIPVPSCIPSCQVPPFDGSSKLLVDGSKRLYSRGERAELSCSPGYKFENNGNYTFLLCLSSGWHKAIPRCIPST